MSEKDDLEYIVQLVPFQNTQYESSEKDEEIRLISEQFLEYKEKAKKIITDYAEKEIERKNNIRAEIEKKWPFLIQPQEKE